MFAGLRWVWVQILFSIAYFLLRENAYFLFDAFGKMECLFSIAPDANSCGWLIGARVKKLEVKTRWSQRRWRRSTDWTLGLKAPDAGRLRPVRLTYDDAEAGV